MPINKNKIRAKLALAGKTQADLARACGVNKSTITRALSGHFALNMRCRAIARERFGIPVKLWGPLPNNNVITRNAVVKGSN